jgi:hypothetical protein
VAANICRSPRTGEQRSPKASLDSIPLRGPAWISTDCLVIRGRVSPVGSRIGEEELN